MSAAKKAIATVTINGAGKLSDKDAKKLALWLRRTGDALLKERKKYAEKFTARYF